jgi:hypothetical protein
MTPRTVGTIPATANVEAPEACKKKRLEPCLTAAQAGERVGLFLDAAPCVSGAFLGRRWCVERRLVTTPSGRQRVHVWAARNATTHDLFTVQHLPYGTAAPVWELLRVLAGASPGQMRTSILDHARDQRCALVQEVAASVGIALLFLPPSSPPLTLSERWWKCVKKQGLYGTYSPESAAFQPAIVDGMAQAPTPHQAA